MLDMCDALEMPWSDMKYELNPFISNAVLRIVLLLRGGGVRVFSGFHNPMCMNDYVCFVSIPNYFDL